MRIAMFMPGLGPEALGWQVHLDFAAAVRDLGHSFDLLTTWPSGDGPGDGSAASGAAAHPGVAEVLTPPARWSALAGLAAPALRARGVLPAAGALRRWLRSAGREYDLLHVEVAYPHGAAAALAIAAAGWKGALAITPMGEDTLIVDDAAYGFRRHWLPRRLIGWTLRRAALIRSISPLIDEWLAEIAPGTPRRVIPLNVSAAALAAAQRPDADRQERRRQARRNVDEAHGTGDRPLVLALGRLHPFKGIDLLVEALASVPDASLLVAGPSLELKGRGDTAGRLLGLADRCGVAERVRWLGAVPPAAALDLLAAADVVAVPSRLESLNKVCMEAAAVATPFVVTETTGISAWVRDDGVGLVVPPRNRAALAWAIDEVLGGSFQPDLAAMRRFALQFSPRGIAERVVAFYEEVVGSPKL